MNDSREEQARGGERPEARFDAAWAVLGAASRDKADAFLARQTELSALQMENLRLENRKLHAAHAFELSHIRFRRFSDYAKFSLEIAGFLVVLLIVCGLATMVWSATQDRDLVVDAFSVPPDVAQSGMTGSVLAGRVLDTFGRMQSSIGVSVIQGADSYHADSSEEVRVEIPETGISIGELNRYLREWLGRETHVTGDLVRTTKGYALTTRAGGQPGATTEGADMNVLIEKAAERVFAAVRPLRYLDWLEANKRMPDALVAVVPLTKAGDTHDRAVAYAAWAGLLADSQNLEAALAKARTAAALDPQNPTAVGWSASVEFYLGHDEAAWRLASRNAGLWHGAEVADLDPSVIAGAPLFFEARRNSLVGDWAAVLKTEDWFEAHGADYSETFMRAEEAAEDHDVALARSFARAIRPKSDAGAPNPQFDAGQMLIALMLDDWNTAAVAGRRAELLLSADPNGPNYLRLTFWPKLAYALARAGRFAEADNMIAKTPPDCDAWVRARGNVAAAEGKWIVAAHDFSIVSSRSPDIPFADTDWGSMLLRKGEYDAAIEKFRDANLKGPHFADPLEMWGEALMQKNRSDLALAKFAEANNYAPNWGRLHLEWGKALYYSGRRDDAKTQFGIASHLDLSNGDAAALARLKVQHV